MVDSEKERESGTGIYVLAWILAGIAGNLAGTGLASVAYSGVRSADELTQRSIMVLPISVALSASIAIGVYALFPRIMISKVVPYFWWLGALGMLLSIGQLGRSAVEFPPLFYLLIVVEFVLTVLAMLWGFRRLGRL